MNVEYKMVIYFDINRFIFKDLFIINLKGLFIEGLYFLNFNLLVLIEINIVL